MLGQLQPNDANVACRNFYSRNGFSLIERLAGYPGVGLARRCGRRYRARVTVSTDDGVEVFHPVRGGLGVVLQAANNTPVPTRAGFSAAR